ncbi:hypothetical protein, partial [Staphylococcus sp. 11261D007BR]
MFKSKTVKCLGAASVLLMAGTFASTAHAAEEDNAIHTTEDGFQYAVGEPLYQYPEEDMIDP